MKRGLIILTFLTLIYSSSTTYAQTEVPQPIEHEATKIIKASAYTLGHIFTPAFQFSYEKVYLPNYAWQIDVGYINDLNYQIWDEQLNGFRVRFEHREYRHDFTQLKYYHGFAIQTKHTFAQNEQWITRYDQSYLELRNYGRWTASVGAFFSHGFQSHFEDNKTVIDLGMLYGFRLMYRQYFNFPDDAQLNNTLIGFRPGWHFFPAVFPVLKFGVVL